MMYWLYLILAIVFEVTGTMSLRASEGMRNKKWLPVIVGGYVLAFVFLGLALRAGMALGVAYGIWAAAGVALTAIASRMIFGDKLTRTMGIGIALIAVGVFTVELGSGMVA